MFKTLSKIKITEKDTIIAKDKRNKTKIFINAKPIIKKVIYSEKAWINNY